MFSLILNKNPNLSEICFKYISNEGLRLIATHCGQSLRRIEARVGDESADAIKALCQACPNLIVLILGNEDVSGDEIIPTIVEYCPMIEVVSADKWHLTDTAMNALANLHTLKELKLFDYASCSSQAIQRVLQSNPGKFRVPRA